MRDALRLTSFRIKLIPMAISNGTKAISPSAIRSWDVMLIQRASMDSRYSRGRHDGF
jgi:hypothetical protein